MYFLTYLKVPNCEVGYVGPGGIDEYSANFNCSGGVAGWLDNLILGHKHMHQKSLIGKIFKTNQPFDPEGILGLFNYNLNLLKWNLI